MRTHARITAGLAVVLAASAGLERLQSQQSPNKDEVARLQFENGRALMQRGNYEEGLKDFRTVAETYPESALADNARLAMSRYYLELGHDPAAAVKEAEEILKRYPASDSAPFALLVQGEVLLQRSRRKEDLSTAVTTFERVPSIYPRDAEAVPRAHYLAAEALRLSQQPARALMRYRLVLASYPTHSIIPKAHIGAATALVATGDTAAALEEFQFARADGASREDADTALGRLSLLYRLYVRPAQASPFTTTAKDVLAPRAKDVTSMAITPRGEGYFATKLAVLPFDASKGDAPPGTVKPRAIALDERGRLVAIDGGSVKRQTGSPQFLNLTTPNGQARTLEETITAVTLKNGDWLVASDDERDEKGIQRFSPTIKHLGAFAPFRAARLAVDEFDEVAVLDRDAKTVKILDDAGKQVAALPPRGTGYDLRNPVDIAFDALSHLYVLDRTAVYVFSVRRPTPTLLRSFAEPETSPSSFRRATAFALDPLGRLYIADDHVEKIRIYQ